MKGNRGRETFFVYVQGTQDISEETYTGQLTNNVMGGPSNYWNRLRKKNNKYFFQNYEFKRNIGQYPIQSN